MGQVFSQLEKIGALSHSSGTITLAPSRLTIGGQQYSTSSLNLVLSGLSANTLYMIFAVVNNGVVSLVQSTNYNSVGPAGYSAWKLVGAFYSNGVASVAFGSFVNIEGIPVATDVQFNLANATWSNSSQNNRFTRIGSQVTIRSKTTWSGTSGNLTMTLPTALYMSTQDPIADQVSRAFYSYRNPGVQAWLGTVQVSPANGLVTPFVTNSSPATYGGNITASYPTAFGSSHEHYFDVTYNVAGWSNTPLKDL